MHFPQTNKQANTEKINFAKGRVVLSKRMNFRKSSKRGGVISNPKIYIADFCHYKRFFGHVFLKKTQYDFPKMRGGGSKAVWNFSKNLSVLVGQPVPKCKSISPSEILSRDSSKKPRPSYETQDRTKTFSAHTLFSMSPCIPNTTSQKKSDMFLTIHRRLMDIV